MSATDDDFKACIANLTKCMGERLLDEGRNMDCMLNSCDRIIF